jgi:hypothetical protein
MHQVIELPPIALDVTHWVLYQGWCLGGRSLQAVRVSVLAPGPDANDEYFLFAHESATLA